MALETNGTLNLIDQSCFTNLPVIEETSQEEKVAFNAKLDHEQVIHPVTVIDSTRISYQKVTLNTGISYEAGVATILTSGNYEITLNMEFSSPLSLTAYTVISIVTSRGISAFFTTNADMPLVASPRLKIPLLVGDQVSVVCKHQQTKENNLILGANTSIHIQQL